MNKFFKSGVRSGLSVSTRRYAKVNNPVLPYYNSKEPESSLIYLDANALHFYAMIQPLPVSD